MGSGAGNATPSWTWVSTPHINSGMFSVPAGCWFDPGDHPNPEPYYILEGTLHLSNPDTSDVVELRAGDASNIPAWSHHHGFNFGDEDCYIAWWVPARCTPTSSSRRSRTTRSTSSLVRAQPGRANGGHDRNEGFESRLDQLRSWPGGPKTDVDMMKLDRSTWLHLITGDEPRQSYLTSFFYCDEQIRAGRCACRCGATRSRSRPVREGDPRHLGHARDVDHGDDGRSQGRGRRRRLPARGVEHSFMSVGAFGTTAVFGMASVD